MSTPNPTHLPGATPDLNATASADNADDIQLHPTPTPKPPTAEPTSARTPTQQPQSQQKPPPKPQPSKRPDHTLLEALLNLFLLQFKKKKQDEEDEAEMNNRLVFNEEEIKRLEEMRTEFLKVIEKYDERNLGQSSQLSEVSKEKMNIIDFKNNTPSDKNDETNTDPLDEKICREQLAGFFESSEFNDFSKNQTSNQSDTHADVNGSDNAKGFDADTKDQTSNQSDTHADVNGSDNAKGFDADTFATNLSEQASDINDEANNEEMQQTMRCTPPGVGG